MSPESGMHSIIIIANVCTFYKLYTSSLNLRVSCWTPAMLKMLVEIGKSRLAIAYDQLDISDLIHDCAFCTQNDVVSRKLYITCSIDQRFQQCPPVSSGAVQHPSVLLLLLWGPHVGEQSVHEVS